MSFLKKLFGGGSSEPEPIEYEGFKIVPTPRAEGTQFRLCAEITGDVGGETCSHMLIRADMLGSREEAEEAAIRKAKQMIDEQGVKLFG